MAELYLGTARARLGPAAAMIDAERGAVAACEENRLTRARDASTAGPPELATAELLRFLRRLPTEISRRGGVGEEGDVDPHQAHAMYAFAASGFDEAAVLVVDAEASVWRPAPAQGSGIGDQGSVQRVISDKGSDRAHVPSASRFPIADQYSRLTERLGFRAGRDEHLVEAMARAGQAEAASEQRRLGEQLLELLAEVKAQTGSDRVCLSGGIFFNTYFTSLAAGAGIFAETYIPPHPGRNGSALGAALLVARDQGSGTRDQGSGTRDQGSGARDQKSGARDQFSQGSRRLRSGQAAISSGHRMSDLIGSPHLGPSYTNAEIKEALENCKLSFDLMHDERLLERVAHELSRGRLVGWYHGRLEWGPRALGHRSVLADPFSPHVLENLNGFLKRRPAFRTYGVSVPASRLAEYFEVPAAHKAHEAHEGHEGSRFSREGVEGNEGVGGGSEGREGRAAAAVSASPFMQYEYRPRDLDRFRTILPVGVQTIRVHTVDESEPRYLRLLELWGEKCGTPILVNTSFNGFHEPLVCSPRDAIRVFYGTGLDVLAMENFYLRK